MKHPILKVQKQASHSLFSLRCFRCWFGSCCTQDSKEHPVAYASWKLWLTILDLWERMPGSCLGSENIWALSLWAGIYADHRSLIFVVAKDHEKVKSIWALSLWAGIYADHRSRIFDVAKDHEKVKSMFDRMGGVSTAVQVWGPPLACMVTNTGMQIDC